MDHDLILARYGEIGLKSRPVRRRFEGQLKDNILYAFEQEELDCVVKRIPGRFLVMTSDIEKGVDILSRIFGLTSVSPARRAKSPMDEILAAGLDYAREWRAENPDARTFAVRSRRSGDHEFSSQDVAVKLGRVVLEDEEAGANLEVNLDEADFELHVDVRGTQTFIFSEKIEGPGGLPLGTAGRVVALLKDRNSLVGAWLMMKRGCTVLPIHFEGPTGRPERAAEYEKVLRRWYLRGGLRSIDHTEAADFPDELACALCVRQMVRKAARFAKRRRAKTVVTGELLSSTTAPHMGLAAETAEVTILRPLMGLLPTMVAKTARRIGLSDASARDEGREPCPLRVAGPVSADDVHAYEKEAGIVDRVAEAVAGGDA